MIKVKERGREGERGRKGGREMERERQRVRDAQERTEISPEEKPRVYTSGWTAATPGCKCAIQ